ncbi:uroporphyrin-III C-methyltransferase / precorrin-2 dehydrogenase / sirohydrochlorin ferrochelatase [Streptoalloteichus tenebrarius]|uniref:Uroporphyrin-III C-methyltransferase / precorrin-2 dehydrogenase / sirohydrochlorin ferrochelatase n=1 Tax=Streptoalloteichus tenebrarius (strain ATCC 17920 / DSM 40477 / JCM 4838 / CBS 697.72 / NBRC 16177 / NCIMB 11028 / NRRL B-12390 / A12253. 1 / ISP 5477) TaxID=1933 RepID=A0ABT1HN01_STRSD|nr:uroporphyrinogen-III C-methyltransferase [Streptoalloteichus tenebrarius]MCP2256873.1 uroporphyrin-III C-methyltransferase / precorrin-2 dehydrogenase / sirohydrochlorin ferrochelatase [Streptoalloteichus tenebrarius]BFF00220.1 uroporphyrinogen-III C-methyltransferase [Streptoalloteichus tenebrarius]
MHAEQHYLAGLDLTGRRVVVVGGGTVAQRRLPRLVAAGAAVEVIAPDVTPAVEGMVDAGELVWHPRTYADGDLDAAWYAIACTPDAEVNAAVAAEAERRRVFCVRADVAEGGTAVTPAVGEHEGLLVGVLAGGRPRRSAAVRDALLGALREGRVPDHADHAEPADAPLPGVALVGGGPGDPDLVTVRGRRLLARADVVVVDRLAPRELLDELPPHVQVVDASKIPYGRAASQDAINATLVEHALAGRFVVRLKGGDPYLFGRGFEELIACAEAGVPVTVVPGVTSAFAVPAVADVPVTHRGVAHEVVVVSGHVAPDDPRSLVDWPALARLRGTLVLLMAVERAGEIAEALLTHGRAPGTPVAVIQEGTTRNQRVVRTTLGVLGKTIEAEGVRPPAIIVIGPVAGLAAELPSPSRS